MTRTPILVLAGTGLGLIACLLAGTALAQPAPPSPILSPTPGPDLASADADGNGTATEAEVMAWALAHFAEDDRAGSGGLSGSELGGAGLDRPRRGDHGDGGDGSLLGDVASTFVFGGLLTGAWDEGPEGGPHGNRHASPHAGRDVGRRG